MKLILTPWNGKRLDLLEECIASVKHSLGDMKAEHRVVRCGPSWEETMFEMRDDAELVAWVDADDLVYGDALPRCFEALEASDVALAYTDEAEISEQGEILKVHKGQQQLLGLASHPRQVHHLTVTRRGTIDEAALELFKQTRAPLDWLMRARAGCRFGMKRVPMVGYGWRRHGEQITASQEWVKDSERSVLAARAVMRTWINWDRNLERP